MAYYWLSGSPWFRNPGPPLDAAAEAMTEAAI
jgi:hypothetical protein